MVKHVFVARERELAQLDGLLERALAAEGLVCFVTGEAGSGKTALVTEFARRAQERDDDLAVAVGQSDAQTGVGDAHLPFREVLGQLTGDVEAKLAQGAISEENASRLRKLLVLSGQALVDVGPDLIGVFVPGAGLAARVGAFAAEKVGWLDKLEKLVGKQREGTGPGASGIEQSQIFEQYANVLAKLSNKHPLLLVLDDLQWADAASIGLLFRLARRIGGHRILLVGTYRPEEVAIGRAGERHPLEKVLAELKRYHGDISVDLDRAEEVEGRGFVDAFLNTEANKLAEGFRDKLFKHTGGHPLFTIELLRTMQERGDLVRDRRGRWVETPALAWGSLPERVEGVIEERIGRLEQELRQMLTVGSVEGEDFTAEVVARVQAAEAGGLVRRLSGELERQHRLVRARGIRRLDPAGQRLSLYRFQHNLFQRYLYNELDEAERAYLHEDVGNALEELYGDEVDEIAVQLARHFEQAGIANKARIYLHKAGKQAADRFANDEAISYFSRALDLTPEGNPDERYALLLAREQIYGLQGERELQTQDLAALQELAQILGDNQKWTELALRQAAHADATSNYPAAVAAAQEAVRLAEAVQDTSSQAVGHLRWGAAAWHQGDSETARCQLEQALALSRAAGLRRVEASSLRSLGVVAGGQGDYDRAQTYSEEAVCICREEGDRLGESRTLINLGAVFSRQGDHARARACEEQALSVFREIGDRQREGVVLGNLGVASFQQGDLRAARTCYEQSRLISQEVGDRDSESRMLGNLGGVSGSLGDLAAARRFLERALLLVREIGRQRDESYVLNELGFTLAMQGDYAAAGDYCGRSLLLARELGDRWYEANALGNLGAICDRVGDYSGARHHYEASLEIAHSMGDRSTEARVLANLGLLCHHLGEDQPGRECSQHALEIAQELGDPQCEAYAVTHLGHALAGLGQLAEAADTYRQGLALRQELGQPHLATEPLAGLARVYLLQENPIEAQAFIKEILGHLESHTLEGTEEPLRIYLTCYRVLTANHDPRAADLLKTAHCLLQERAARIVDEELRRSYLENVPAHREIVQEFAKTGCLERPFRSGECGSCHKG
jgi:adenylate cyclase